MSGKKRVIQLQSIELLSKMVISSKMDRVLVSGFSYDGSMMKYLAELDFLESRAIFISRYRMWPTKENYPGRWSGDLCNICNRKDTDEHIFSCPGYMDLIGEKFDYQVFWDRDVLDDMVQLKEIAKIVLILVERMEYIQNLNLSQPL